MKHYIYGLIDPITETLRYVGVTQHLLTRRRQHLNMEHAHSKNLVEWKICLNELGRRPIFIILGEYDSSAEAKQSERQLIKTLPNLLNKRV